MKRMTYFVMALAMVLGFTQCKKEQIEPQGGQVRITLDVENRGNNGSRVEVDPPHVTFEKGDKILVGYNGAYVGTLTHNGTRFEGNIDATVTGSQKLYFYFVGNKQGTLSVGDTECTVNISDQTKELPVLSFAASNEDFEASRTNYSASLHNQCALVKFPLQNPAGSIMVGGMNTGATINFANPSITPTENVTGSVRLYSKADKEKWAILLPQAGVTAPVTIGDQTGLTVEVPAIKTGAYITSISAITNASTEVLLSELNMYNYYTAKDSDILKGTLSSNMKISIAEGAWVTLNGVDINSNASWTSGDYAGLTCLSDATIILSGTNKVEGFHGNYPGIYVQSGSTLTIQGSGSLEASSNSRNRGSGAGIGGGSQACGNIRIEGGIITATGGWRGGAGIGSGYGASCGNITITGGTVEATGGTRGAAGIGSGYYGSCEDITITNTVTKVTATMGDNATNSIGAGSYGSCGTVTIGGVVGAIPTSPYTYQP